MWCVCISLGHFMFLILGGKESLQKSVMLNIRNLPRKTKFGITFCYNLLEVVGCGSYI